MSAILDLKRILKLVMSYNFSHPINWDEYYFGVHGYIYYVGL